MADCFINIFLDDEKIQKLTNAGLAGEIREIDGKKAIQVKATDKEQKKMTKGFPDMPFDADNVCVLPDTAANTVFNIVCDMKTLDVMKFAIMKIYNPLAGKALRSAMR